ncbi:hypothetical protein Q8F55_008875 [Vanrija albida]|uniref:Uncharacterized protein n=1 Tax=Vanrija albida TaxID=181172 RepID=A0ABR3PS32_9TREE
MIIPPDPEKDPNLFAETASVLDEDLRLVDVPLPPDAVYHPSSAPTVLATYPYGAYSEEDLGAWQETLPPYEGRRVRTRQEEENTTAAEASTSRIFGAPQQQSRPRASVFVRPSSQASGSSGSSSGLAPYPDLLTSRRPTSSRAVTASPTAASVSISDQSTKTWEGLIYTRRRKRRICGIPVPSLPSVPVAPEVVEIWHKHRKWIIAGSIVLATLLVLTIGLVVGFSTAWAAKYKHKRPPGYRPWYDKGGPPNASWQMPDLNLTYVGDRDGPAPADGTPSNCNDFLPLNDSATVSQLANLASPFFENYITTFTYPLDTINDTVLALPNDLYFIARGLAASGTIEFVGSKSPPAVVMGGTEGFIQVDVIARIAVGLNLTHIVNVCQLDRDDGSTGVGIYTPLRTDGGADIPGLLDPLRTPAFHVIVRVPPSVLNTTTPKYAYLPKVSLDLTAMATRVGDLQDVASFGTFGVTAHCRGGAVVADYLEANTLNIYGAEGTVQGTFNISSSLMINSTSGTIFANILLNDPAVTDDNSTTLATDLPGPKRRGLSHSTNFPATGFHPYPTPAQMEEAANIAPPTHAINTTFITKAGFIFVAYLHHPPTTALQALVASQSGMVDVAMHPNFVGPFAAANVWGSVRLPPPLPSAQLEDPAHLGRTRFLVQGDLDVSDDTFFASHGINSTTTASSTTIVTGAVYWGFPQQASTLTPKMVQSQPEGGTSALVAVANLGDLQVTFDGT